MESNLYFVEIIYFIFYALLSLFIYLNSAAIYNFSQSNKIIIENSLPRCIPNISSLPFLTENQNFKQCKTDSSKYFYDIPKENLSFIVTKEESQAQYFITTCKKYCNPGFKPVQNKCEAKNSTPFDNCIRLLRPSPNCSDNSSAIAVDKEDGKFLYVYKNAASGGSNGC